MKSPFQKELDSLDLTFAQNELIMQASERYVIGKNETTPLIETYRGEPVTADYTRNRLRAEQRIALRGEPDLSYNGGNNGNSFR